MSGVRKLGRVAGIVWGAAAVLVSLFAVPAEAVPVLVEIRAEDLNKDVFSDLARVKIDGVTESHPLADGSGFVPVPIDILMEPATVQLTPTFTTQATYGPFSVPVVAGKVRAVNVNTGSQASGNFSSTRIQLLYPASDVEVGSLDQANAPIDARVRVKVTGVTESLAGADVDGYVGLPVTLPKVLISQPVEVRSRVDDILDFGPHSYSLQNKKVTVYNYDDNTVSSGGAPTTQLKLKYDTATLPLLAVSSLDLEDVPLAAGRSHIKITGVTESLPGADGDGFVSVPVSIPNFTSGTYSVSVRLDDRTPFGPYNVGITLGQKKEIKAADGVANSSGPHSSSELVLRYRVADVDLFAQDQTGAAIADGSVKAEDSGVTESLPGADVDGFAPLPQTASKIWLTQVDITWKHNDLLVFGPFDIGVDAFNDVKVVNPDGTEFGTGSGAQTGLGLRLDLTALPLLEVRTVDLDRDPLTAGRAKIKIDGVTESLPGADAQGFVDLPIDIPNVAAGSYQVSSQIDGKTPFGPYPVTITLGEQREIKALDGTSNSSGPFTSTRLTVEYRVADLQLFAQDQTTAPIADGSVKAKITGVTETMPGADANGFVALPVEAPKVWIAGIEGTWTYNDLLTFGPYNTFVTFGNSKVLNQNGTTFGTGAAAQTGLGVRLNLTALPLLEVRTVDLDRDPLTAGRAKIKIDGVTESLPGADAQGFVDLPIDIPNVAAGSYQVSSQIDGKTPFGPYPVTITLGEQREIKALDGTSNSSGPFTSTRLTVEYRVADLQLFAQDQTTAPIADGSVKAKITGVTETMPGADANGFVALPVEAPKVWIAGIEGTWTYNDLLTFGPYNTFVTFGNSKVLNQNGTTFGTGAAAQTGLGVRLNLTALPLLEVRTVDLQGDALASGRGKIKIDGVTESLPGADAQGFVSLPIDIANVAGGTYQVSAMLDGHPVGGPYPVTITLGNVREVKAADGASNLNGPFTSTRLRLQYNVSDLELFAQGTAVPVKAKIPGVTDLMPGADTNGFVLLPAVAPKVWLTSIDITFLYDDLLTFGPFLTPIDAFNDVKVLNMDGTEYGTAEGTVTGLGILIDPNALPLLQLRAEDFEDDPLAAGRILVKIDGVTESLPQADANGFVEPPIDIPDVVGGSYQISTTLDGSFSYGPYPVSITLGNLKEIKAIDGTANTNGPAGMTRLVIEYPVADLELFAQDQFAAPVSDGSVKARVPGVTDGHPDADANGYLALPDTLDKVVLDPVTITWTLNDLLVFGPYAVPIDKFGDVKVMNSNGTPFGTGAGSITGLGVRLDFEALPVLKVSALDLEDDPLAAGRAFIKVAGYTEALPGADIDGFVEIPVDIPNVPSGTHSMTTRLDDDTVYGPYDVTIQLGDVKEIKATDGSANSAGPSTETRLTVRYDVADVLFQGANASGAPLGAGRVTLKLDGLTESLPGADAGGFVDLPLTISDMLLLQALTASVTFDDTLAYGPYPVAIDKFQDIKVFDGPTGNELGTGAGTITEVRFQFGTNQDPVADAGPDLYFECLANSMYVPLDGSGSSDPDGDDLTYTWTLNGDVIASGDQEAAEKPTVLLPLGVHLVTLTVDDGNDATDSDDVQVTVAHDTTPPVVVVTHPLDGAWVKGPRSVRVEGTVTEASKLVSVTAGGKKARFVGEAPDYTFQRQVGGLSEGANVIDVIAEDVSGNEGSAQVSFNIDATKPAVTFLTPTDGGLILTSPVHVEVEVTETQSGVASVLINNVEATLVSGTTYAADIEISRDGDRKIWAQVVDNVGWKTREFITVTFDDDAPRVRIQTPSKNSLVTSPALTVIGTVKDNGSGIASVTVNSVPAVVTGNAYKAVVPVSDGPLTLTATATDNAGRIGEASVDLTVETSGAIPTVGLTLEDSDGSPIVGARVDLRRVVNGNERGGGARQNTDVNGQVEFEASAGQIYRLRIVYHGGTYTTGDLAGDGTNGLPASATVQTELVALSLTDSGSQPVDGVRVDLLKASAKGTGVYGRTGEDGNPAGIAEFQVLPGVGYRFRVRHSKGNVIVPSEGGPAAVGAGTQLVQTQLSALTLTSSTGSKLEDVRIDLLREDGRGAGEWLKTDANGVAAFEVLSVFAHRFRIRYSGGQLIVPDLDSEDPLVGGEDAALSTVLTTFTLTNSSNDPLPDVRVDLLKADGKGTGVRTKTDGSGIARFEVLPGFQHLFRVHYHGGTYTTDETVSIPAGSE